MFRGKDALEYESTLERDFIVRCEFSMAVSKVVPQPCSVEYHNPFVGRRHIYTPDFLVYHYPNTATSPRRAAPMLIEVKPKAQWHAHWRRWLPKWKAAYAYAKHHGWQFHIHDESRIRDQAFRNIIFLTRYKHMTFSEKDSQVLIELITQLGVATVDRLLTSGLSNVHGENHIALIWHLLARRVLDCNIVLPLSNHTELWVSHHE